MKSHIIAGLDLGNSKITCMIAKISSAEPIPEIIGAGTSEPNGFSNGMVVNLQLAAQSIESAVSTAESQAGVKLTELYTAITGAHISGESSKASFAISRPDKEISSEDVSQLIQQATAIDIPSGRTIIHFVPQEFVLDGLSGIHDPIGMNADHIEANVYVVTATSTAIQNIQKAVYQAGFNVRKFLPQPVVASFSVLERSDQELGCMLIDIGAGTTDIVVFYNGGIYDTLSLNLGGNDITNDIAIGFSIPRPRAEELKVKHGVARSDFAFTKKTVKSRSSEKPTLIKVHSLGKNTDRIIDQESLVSIIAPRVEEIFALLYRKLKFPVDLELLPAGIILTGGGAKMPGIKGLAERVFGIPTKIGIPNTVQSLNQYKDSSFSTSVGLILYASLNNDNCNNKKMGKVPKKPVFVSVSNRVKKWLLE